MLAEIKRRPSWANTLAAGFSGLQSLSLGWPVTIAENAAWQRIVKQLRSLRLTINNSLLQVRFIKLYNNFESRQCTGCQENLSPSEVYAPAVCFVLASCVSTWVCSRCRLHNVICIACYMLPGSLTLHHTAIIMGCCRLWMHQISHL